MTNVYKHVSQSDANKGPYKICNREKRERDEAFLNDNLYTIAEVKVTFHYVSENKKIIYL